MKKKITRTLGQAGISLLVLAFIFTAIEPAISFGAVTTSQFTISQTITSEIAFATPAANVTMSPSLGGITGGTSNGQTQVVVTTNNSTGYNMTLTASSSLGMIGNASSSNYIPAYVPAAGLTPDYSFTTPANAARFGYSVAASSTGDNVTLFKNSGAACNTGSNTNSPTSNTTINCWLNASTTAITIINRSLQTPASGATSTVYFRVNITSNPSPVIPNDTYVATSTLTATTNP
ncbi:MAG TPA: hypothetical protein VL335_02985 [Candidatus Paceibacterota bacterium]|jgi:hypothetical protein|nr:hypothetical protein [Candidatus Paceibacterota bacterium]